MIRLLVLLSLSSVAFADPLDLKATLKKTEKCGDLSALGTIERAETIGKRPESQLVHLFGKKARGYIIFAHETCFFIPVVGKPAAFVKGNFGNGATAAFALRSGISDGDPGVSVVTLKKDDTLLDLLLLPSDCEDGMTMIKKPIFAGRDSIVLGCYSSGGADQGHSDMLIDTADGNLALLLDVNAGIAWIQIPWEEGKPHCTARSPGRLSIVTPGANPVVDAVEPAEFEEAEAAKVEWTSGGCEAIVKTKRLTWDGKKFAAKTKPRFSRVKKLCSCKKGW